MCNNLVKNMNNKHFYLKKIINSTLLSNKSLSTLSETKSENTINAYESDWDDFCDWCIYNKFSAFPATSETVVNYINDLADYAKSSTIKRRVSAISENYNAAIASGINLNNPCKNWIIKEALIGLNRKKGTRQKGKTPLYWEDLKKIIVTMNLSCLTDIRDKAILLLGFMGAFRRSELTSLELNDITFVPQGIIITVKESKTDQEKAGQTIGIPYLEDKNMCAVSALKLWIKEANITKGPLFRRLLKNGKTSDNALSDKSINLIVKKYVNKIGLQKELYGAHSLRHGFATFAAMNGIEERIIMKQTRHHSVEMVRHYINEADLFINNPISIIFNKT